MSKAKTTPLTFSLHEWVALKDAFDRIMSFAGERGLAANYLNQDLRSGRLGSALVQISSDGEKTETVLDPSVWEQWTVRVPPLRVDGLDPNVNRQFFVRRVDLDKRYPIAATQTMTAAHQSDETRPPERRRGPIPTHDWHVIDGEIARRCINPKTRLLEIPKSERRLAQHMLDWCQEKYGKEPAESEMREAVKAICAALREAYK